jgi:hypothetical protein
MNALTSWRELGRATQARDATLVALLSLELQDLQQERQRGLLLGLYQPRHHFRARPS